MYDVRYTYVYRYEYGMYLREDRKVYKLRTHVAPIATPSIYSTWVRPQMSNTSSAGVRADPMPTAKTTRGK